MKSLITGITASFVLTIGLFAAESSEAGRSVDGRGVVSEAVMADYFRSPPPECRPRTWWHWISNNVSKQGITKDLEAMKRIGLKGAQITTMPQGAPFGDVKYLSPEWMEAAEHAQKEAKRLGLTVGFSNALACSGAGGPWITPELSMQKLVWSEVAKRGPCDGTIEIAQPETYEGFYRDLKVFAFPTIPGDDIPLGTWNPEVSSDIPELKSAAIMDGDLKTRAEILATKSGHFIQLTFSKPMTASSVNIYLSGSKETCEKVSINVLTSKDGEKWGNLRLLSGRGSFSLSDTHVLSSGFPELSTSYFKFEIKAPVKQRFSINEISFGSARLPLITCKAARSSNHPTQFEYNPLTVAADQIVDSGKIIDLTGKMTTPGSIRCTLPEGNWTIIRFGHTSTGKKMAVDHPTDTHPPGLEADKMSRKAILTHLNQGLVGQVLEHYKHWKDTVRITINIDSWECGTQTWTPEFPQEFQKRRGYDCLGRLLAVTGRIVDNVDLTERYLWDYRRTIADLYAENFYGTFRDFCHAHDMQLDGEAPGIGIPAIADGLQCLGMMDIPQGEFWIQAKPGPNRNLGLGGSDNTKEAAVGAHVYGKTIASCEAFTAFGYADGWQMDPQQLKPIGDRQFCLGMNEMMFHRYVHQPDERVPGMTLGQFGLNFDRTLTWWEQGRSWIEYITRCQFMLRQGLFVADVCYFYGENAPCSVYYFSPPGLDPRKMNKPVTPPGYDYDCCDWTTLSRMTVKDGRVVLPDGMSYAYLVMPEKASLTVHALKKVSELIKAGATVVGSRPSRSPSLANYPEADRLIQDMAAELWSETPAAPHPKGMAGRVIEPRSFTDIFMQDQLDPDFEAVPQRKDLDIRYIHRRTPAIDLYYVSNQSDRSEEVTLKFRVAGKVPEIWHPETGLIMKAPIYRSEGKRTAVAVRMAPYEAYFMVFRSVGQPEGAMIALKKDGQDTGLSLSSQTSSTQPSEPPGVGQRSRSTVSVDGGTLTLRAWESGTYTAELSSGAKREVVVGEIPAPVVLDGPWKVVFQSGRLAPEGPVVFDKLGSWTEHPLPGIRYFSGTACYSKTVSLAKSQLTQATHISLDLGMVKNVAEVVVNGRDVGVLWRSPFCVDIRPALREGENTIEIKVTNLWPNRLIGDQQLPEKDRVTWCFYRFYTKESPLLESGLLGPVTLFSSVEVGMGKL